MKKLNLILALTLLLCAAPMALMAAPGAPLELAGVSVAPTAVMDGVDEPLVLNGAGIRKKVFYDIYVGALYLPRLATGEQAVLNQSGPHRIQLTFTYKNVSQKKIVASWVEGFEDNLSPAERGRLEAQIKRFCSFFDKDILAGDILRFDSLPGKGTEVFINGQSRGVVDGDAFSRALLQIWIGPEPPDESLKRAWLRQ